MKLVNFNCKKSKSNMDIKLAKHLIKKIKGKNTWVTSQGLLGKYFWSLTYLIFFEIKRFF